MKYALPRFSIFLKPEYRKWAIVCGGLFAISVTLCIILIVTCATRPSESGNSPTAERQAIQEISGIPLHSVILPAGSPGRPGTLRTIKSITIHETANESEGADAKAHSEYLLSTSDEVSWHYTVDDRQIYQNLPDNEVAWHSGDHEGNLSSLSIELCVNGDGDFDKTFDNAAKLTAYLLDEYNLTIDDVKQHYDFNQKDCPLTIRQTGRWEEFLTLVQHYR